MLYFRKYTYTFDVTVNTSESNSCEHTVYLYIHTVSNIYVDMYVYNAHNSVLICGAVSECWQESVHVHLLTL